MNQGALLIHTLVRPTDAFRKLNEKPSFVLPLLLVVGLTALSVLVYFAQVDMVWLNDQLVQNEPELRRLAKTNSAPVVTKTALLTASLISVLLVMPLGRLIEAGFYGLAAGVVDARKSYRHWLAIACWSSLPLLLIAVGGLVMLMFDKSGQLMQEQLNLLSVNELILKLPPSAKGYALANMLTLLHPWAWALATIGIREFTGKSWVFSVLMSLSPWLLFYGGWFIFMLV